MTNKIPLLLVPGTLCDSRIWQHQIDNLADIAAVKVVDISIVGSLELLAERVLQQTPGKFALAGFSFGGILAFEIFRQAPQRITHLALISTNARPDTIDTRNAKLAQLAMASEAGLEAMLRSMLLPRYFSPHNSDRVALHNLVLNMAQQAGVDTLIDQVNSVIARPDSRNDLHRIGCPTLVLYGRDDVICSPERHQEIADAIPQAVLQSIEHCGHMSTIECPEQVTAALRNFLCTNN